VKIGKARVTTSGLDKIDDARGRRRVQRLGFYCAVSRQRQRKKKGDEKARLLPWHRWHIYNGFSETDAPKEK